MIINSKHVDGHAYFIRKPMDYLEVMQSTLSKHHHLFSKPSPYKIVKTIELPNDDYRKFVDNNILQDQDFLRENTDSCYVNKDGIWQAIKVINKDNPSESLLVQTEGSNYARYVAIKKYYPENLKEQIYALSNHVAYISKGNNWIQGNIGDYEVNAKVYPKPSTYGIDNGCISKLQITDANNNIIANYDRGWDVKPKDEHLAIYAKAINSLNNHRQKLNKERENRNNKHER